MFLPSPSKTGNNNLVHQTSPGSGWDVLAGKRPLILSLTPEPTALTGYVSLVFENPDGLESIYWVSTLCSFIY